MCRNLVCFVFFEFRCIAKRPSSSACDLSPPCVGLQATLWPETVPLQPNFLFAKRAPSDHHFPSESFLATTLLNPYFNDTLSPQAVKIFRKHERCAALSQHVSTVRQASADEWRDLVV